MKSLFALTILIFPALAGGQNLPSLNVLLDRLDAYAKQYQATLPSLTCHEQITSQALNKRGTVTREVKVESNLREVRTKDPDNPFLERREFKTIDGRRAKATFQTSRMPYFVEGGFASLVGFERWQQRECFEYVTTADDNNQTFRLEMTLKKELRNPSCAKLPAGFHRSLVADRDTGRVLHTERTISRETAARNTEVYFGGIDYAPQKLGELTFWLPSRFYAHDAANSVRMVAIYENCHRYIGELRIMPGGTLPATP
jgi:hypothetical protein